MEELDRLEERRERILLEIRGIRSMRKGSVVEQYLKGRSKGAAGPSHKGPIFSLYQERKRARRLENG